jgi:hypothetical protein
MNVSNSHIANAFSFASVLIAVTNMYDTPYIQAYFIHL